MSTFTVVVAGLPQMVEALNRTGQFQAVHGVGSTSGLRDLLAQLGGNPDGKVFIFSDATPVDTKQTLAWLIQRMTSLGTRVVVTSSSPLGEELVRQCPGAGLITGPVKVNTVLGGLRSLGIEVTPVADAENLDISLDLNPGPLPLSAPVTAAPPAFEATNPFAQPAAAAPAAPFPAPQEVAPQPTAPAPVTPPTPEPANPFAVAQPASGPAANPFATAAPTPAAPAPAAPAPAAPAPALTPFPVSTPTAEPANPFAAVPAAPEPGNPFGTQSSAPEAGNPFGTPAPAATESGNPFASVQPAVDAGNPFGTQTAPAPEPGNPFGGAQFSVNEPAPASPFTPSPGLTPLDTPPAGMAQPTAGPATGLRPLSHAGLAESAVRPRRGYVITVTAPKGGTGKSSLSLNLAAYLGLRLQGSGKNVALIDANVQQADAGKYLNNWSPNIEDVLRDTSAIHPDRIGNYLLHRNDLNLSVLLGPMTPDTAHPVYFSGKKYSQILEAMRPNFDYIIIDTPVAEFYHDIFREFALPQANFVLVAITPNYTTLMNTDAWLRQICAPKQSHGMGFDPNNVGVVLNRAEEDIGFTEEEVIRDLGTWPYLGAIPETKEWKKANNQGKLVATANYHELNEAFSNILAQATREELLATTPVNLASTEEGLLGKLIGRLKKSGR